jgi:hypothetical protein
MYVLPSDWPLLTKIPYHPGVFVISDEETIIHHNYPESSLGLTLVVVCFVGLNKHIMTLSILAIWSSYTVLKILCALPTHPFYSLNTGNH